MLPPTHLASAVLLFCSLRFHCFKLFVHRLQLARLLDPVRFSGSWLPANRSVFSAKPCSYRSNLRLWVYAGQLINGSKRDVQVARAKAYAAWQGFKRSGSKVCLDEGTNLLP